MISTALGKAQSAADQLLVGDAVRTVGLGAELLVAEALVGLEVALEPADLGVALERQHVRGDPVQEPAIVRDDDGAAGERQQRFLQRAQRVGVEVIGGLVEQQQVAAGAQQLGQVQAVALAAGQLAHLGLLVSALEVEAGDVGAAGDRAIAERDLVQSAGDLLPNGLVGIERVTRLVDIRQLDGLAELERARVGLLLPGDHPQQGGLAGAVGADHADDPASRKLEVEVVDQQPVAVGLAQTVGLEHDIAQAGPGGDVDLDLVELDVSVLGQQRLIRVQTRLGLAAPRRRVHPDPLQLLLDRALAAGLLALLLAQAHLLLLQPARVVALIGDPAAPVELEDPAGDVVQEVAIVGDGDDRPRVIAQVLLQPGHGLRVQVVGGLVEQQQVGLAQQQAAERDPPALATGEGGDVGVGGRAAQRVHRVLERGVQVPAVDGVDLLLYPGELVGGLLGVVHRQLVEAIEQRPHLGDSVLDVAAHVLGGVELGLLLEQATVALGASWASPSNSVSSPAMIRSSVDLPEPL